MVHFSWGASISILNKSPDFQLCNCWRNLVSSESGHKLSLNTIGWIFHGFIPWPLYCQTYLFQNCKSQNEFQLNKDSPEGLSASAQESSSWQDRPWFAEPRGCSWHSFAPVDIKLMNKQWFRKSSMFEFKFHTPIYWWWCLSSGFTLPFIDDDDVWV